MRFDSKANFPLGTPYIFYLPKADDRMWKVKWGERRLHKKVKILMLKEAYTKWSCGQFPATATSSCCLNEPETLWWIKRDEI